MDLIMIVTLKIISLITANVPELRNINIGVIVFGDHRMCRVWQVWILWFVGITRIVTRSTLDVILFYSAGSCRQIVLGASGWPKDDPAADVTRRFGVPGECQQNENALQWAKAHEDVPQWRHIRRTGDQSGDPGEAHNQRQADVEAQLLLGATLVVWCRRSGCGTADHAQRTDEK